MRITHELLAPFEVEADSDQFTLIKTGTITSGKNQGEKTEIPLGYYTSLNNCIKRIVHLQVIASADTMDFNDFVKTIREMLQEIQEIQLA